MGLDRLESQIEKEARDLRILVAVASDGPARAAALADGTDLHEHEVRRSLQMLEEDGLVEPTPDGAVVASGASERLAEIEAGIDRLADRVRAFADIFEDADVA